MKWISYIVLIICMIFLVGNVSAAFIIDEDFEDKVLNSRNLMDNFREDHRCLYEACLNSSSKTEIMLADDLRNGLITLGYSNQLNETIRDFFTDSETYNAQVLGYADTAELFLFGDANEQETYISMWN